jgi:tyrosinase
MRTRRSVILSGSVIGAGLIASKLPSLTALAATSPLRRSLQGLAWNDPIVETYRDGVGIMKQLATTEKFNWVNLCAIHGNANSFKYCPHGNWYFLPWHRAFIAMYERVIRHLTKNPDFGLPFWDWTANPLMPDVFLSKTTPSGKPNWLYVDENGRKRTWPDTKPMPDDVVGPKVLAKILKETPFEIFGTSRRPGQNSLDPSWVTRGGGVQGTLEGTAHNLVHNNIGGWMPTSQSPRDPIFFMHHCNIDRIWAVWNLHNANPADPLWTGMTFTDNFWNADGTHWSPKVSDLYKPEDLEYTYGLVPITPPVGTAAAGPKTLALSQKLGVLVATLGTGGPNDAAIVSVDNSKAATATAPLSLFVKLPVGALQAIGRRAPTASGLETMNFSAAMEHSASGPRALAFLRDVKVTDPSTTSFRVFINGDNVSSNTPTTDPHFVGSFGVLDHGEDHSQHVAPSFVIDLTDAIQRVFGSNPPPTNEIQLQLLPVAIGDGKVGTAIPARLEIAILAA